MIRYCKKCVMPETRPDLHIDDDGICSACHNFETRPHVDWDNRQKELLSILESYRSKDGGNHDCIVPVSGGKDSTFQVIKILELGMNPLCVTATTDDLSDIGRRNLDNIKDLGADLIEVSMNPVVRCKINKIALDLVGDISWPEHVAIFTIPIRIAVQMNIPLIIWGENSQHEYGGPASEAEKSVLDSRWLQEFGGLLGMRVSDLVGQTGIQQKDLILYTYPSNEDLHRVGVTGLFLGFYLPWDGEENSALAQAHGFETFPTPIEGQLVNYENLDNHQTGIHDYFAYLKYGMGRVTAQAALQVRRGRMTRSEAIEAIVQREGKFPWTYLGKPIEDILSRIDMTVDEFTEVCDRFTNKKVFRCNNQGELIKDQDGNLLKVAHDNE